MIANSLRALKPCLSGSASEGKKEQEEFWDWAEQMEYQVNKIPREDIVIFLHLPARISQKLAYQRSKKTGKSDVYEKLSLFGSGRKSLSKISQAFPPLANH